MKKAATIVLIIIILLPMLFYLNPFTWGMRRVPHYEASRKTNRLLYELNKKYNYQMEIGDVTDTLWYFRDLKHKKITKLENFELALNAEKYSLPDLKNIENYVKDFNSNFEHKKYFDSLKVVVNYDSIIYKAKIK